MKIWRTSELKSQIICFHCLTLELDSYVQLLIASMFDQSPIWWLLHMVNTPVLTMECFFSLTSSPPMWLSYFCIWLIICHTFTCRKLLASMDEIIKWDELNIIKSCILMTRFLTFFSQNNTCDYKFFSHINFNYKKKRINMLTCLKHVKKKYKSLIVKMVVNNGIMEATKVNLMNLNDVHIILSLSCVLLMLESINTLVYIGHGCFHVCSHFNY